MIKTIFILCLLYLIIEFIVTKLKKIKTDNKKENKENFWLLTYDFKDIKKDSIFDRDTKNVLDKREKKNNLILLLYLSIIAAFFLVNSLVAQILSLIYHEIYLVLSYLLYHGYQSEVFYSYYLSFHQLKQLPYYQILHVKGRSYPYLQQ